MRTSRVGVPSVALVAALVAAACAATNGSDRVGDKVGNSSPPITLTLVTPEQPGRPGADMVERFVAAVDELSDGRVTVEATFGYPPDQPPAFDQLNIQALRAGDFDLALVPARAWRSEGVTTLEPLQLPFLVETDMQADRVAADRDLSGALLAGLGAIDVVGLGLYPEGLRHVVRLDGTPIDATGDLAGLTVRAPKSVTTWAVLETLGAEVVDLNAGDFQQDVVSGRVAAAESSLILSSSLPATGRPSVLTNISLYTKFNVLAISEAAWASLDEEAAAVLDEAASEVRAWVRSERRREADAMTDVCTVGIDTVFASDAEREALRGRLTLVVDSVSAAADVEALVRRTREVVGEGRGQELSDCSETASSQEDLPFDVADLRPVAGDLPNGTYRFRVDEEVIVATYPNFRRSVVEYSAVYTALLDDGHFTLDVVVDNGTTMRHTDVYEVDGEVVTFAVPSGFDFDTSIAVHWRWVAEPDGSLLFEPVGPQDRGERVDYTDLWTVPVWERID